MSNNVMITVASAVLGGALVSLLFYGGLWLTLNLTKKSTHPGILVLLSFLGRSAGAVAVLIVVPRVGSWPALVGAAGITLVARIAVTRIVKQRGGEVQP